MWAHVTIKTILFLLLLCHPALAEHPKGITASGLGTNVLPDDALNPTRYVIFGGTRSGNNLFHSFEAFNLDSNQKCIFNDEGIQNTISRVTGTKYSWINGTITSQANNFYFLNPNGIIFGEKAQLDVNGSFYASTAHYIRSENNITFDMNTDEASLWTSDPYSFGFIQKGNSIKINKSDQLKPSIRVANDNTLAFIGGDFEMNGNRIGPKEKNVNITITISSIQSPGEILINGQYAENNVGLKKGNVSIIDSDIDVSGQNSGCIYIRSGEFFIQNSHLKASTKDVNDGIIHINSDTVKMASTEIFSEIYRIFSMDDSSQPITGPSIHIVSNGEIEIKDCRIITSTSSFFDNVPYLHAGEVIINGQSIDLIETQIESVSEMAGNAGEIQLKATKNIQFIHSSIVTDTNAADAGNVHLNAESILFLNGSGINSTTKGYGKGGEIFLHAEKIIQLSGLSSSGIESSLESYTIEQNGHAGNIYIETKDLMLSDGGKLVVSTMGMGQGGTIDIVASRKISIFGENQYSNSKYSISSGIFSRSTYPEPDAGDAGQVFLETNQLSLFSKGKISTTSLGPGDAGNMIINANSLSLNNHALISSESLARDKGGAAGRINISANDSIVIQNNSALTTEAINTIKTDKSSDNGRIEITTKKRLQLTNGDITTSVHGGSGHGGDIEISAKGVLMNRGKIIANAYEGDGGNIHIISEVFIQSVDSLVDASSEKGIDGIIEIESPDTDPESGLVALTSEFLDVSQWLNNSCEKRSLENISRLIVRGKDALPTKPEDLHSSPVISFKDLQIKQHDLGPVIKKAEIYYQNGDFESAAKVWFNAEKHLDEKYFLISVAYLAQALRSVGFHYKALKLFKKALPVAEKSTSSSDRIIFFNTYGDLMLSLNEIPDAIKFLKIALKQAKIDKNPTMMASVMNNIANVVIVDNDIQTGIQIYDNALALLSKSDNLTLKSKIYLNLAFVISLAGTYEDATAAFNDALTAIQQLPNNHDKAFNCISLSQTGLLIDRFFSEKNSQINLSYRLLKTAQRIGETINNNKIISLASGYVAKILEESGLYEQALQKTRYAIFTAEQNKYDEILYKWHWQAGKLFNIMDKKKQAIDSYRRAILILSDIREELFSGTRLKVDIFDIEIKPVYLELSKIYLDQADIESCSKEKEKNILLARNVMEDLKSAELSDYFEDECVFTKRKSSTNSLNRTPEGVALLYPIALPERLTIIIILPNTITHYNINIRYEELNKLVRNYRKYIQKRSSNEFLEISQKLHHLLIHSVEKDLIAANIHTLLVAPDGVLRLIPFASLHDEKQFLIEKYAIVTIPAISLIDTDPPHKQKTKILVAGLSSSVQDFSSLPAVRDELKEVKRIMNGQTLFLNEAFTVSNIQNEFRNNNYDIVHFATHGVFGGTGKNSFLLTYDSQLDMNILEDIISINKYRNHQVDMLTLSACQTALGNERAALGLAGVAVKAGVRSAVATLWYVDDQATSLAVRELYRQLKKNMTTAKALQNAQKMLISKRKYWHPIYWAPFLLIGNWH